MTRKAILALIVAVTVSTPTLPVSAVELDFLCSGCWFQPDCLTSQLCYCDCAGEGCETGCSADGPPAPSCVRACRQQELECRTNSFLTCDVY
jgi:hypothetical protein